MHNQQLEMTLGKLPMRRSPGKRERRLDRANWWFARMRAAVDSAFDWSPAPAQRPEQICFPE